MHGRSLHRTFAIDRWHRNRSFLHRRDPRAKLAACVVLLAAISLLPSAALGEACLVLALLLLLGVCCGVPPGWLLARAALILPFTAVFAALSYWSGDVERALALPLRAFLSATAVALLVAVTPLERLLAGLRALGVPPFLVDVIHFIWRYLHLAIEQAWRLRIAIALRGGERKFAIAASSVATLFSASYSRAERIHRAILSRGPVSGRLLLEPLRFHLPDVALLACAGAVALSLAFRGLR